MSQLIDEYLLDAVAVISDSEISDQAIPHALASEVRLMAGLDFQEIAFKTEDGADHIIQ